jgi:hypothetical protein
MLLNIAEFAAVTPGSETGIKGKLLLKHDWQNLKE